MSSISFSAEVSETLLVNSALCRHFFLNIKRCLLLQFTVYIFFIHNLMKTRSDESVRTTEHDETHFTTAAFNSDHLITQLRGKEIYKKNVYKKKGHVGSLAMPQMDLFIIFSFIIFMCQFVSSFWYNPYQRWFLPPSLNAITSLSQHWNW